MSESKCSDSVLRADPGLHEVLMVVIIVHWSTLLLRLCGLCVTCDYRGTVRKRRRLVGPQHLPPAVAASSYSAGPRSRALGVCVVACPGPHLARSPSPRPVDTAVPYAGLLHACRAHQRPRGVPGSGPAAGAAVQGPGHAGPHLQRPCSRAGDGAGDAETAGGRGCAGDHASPHDGEQSRWYSGVLVLVLLWWWWCVLAPLWLCGYVVVWQRGARRLLDLSPRLPGDSPWRRSLSRGIGGTKDSGWQLSDQR